MVRRAVKATTAPHFAGKDCIQVYPSSAWAERAFCNQCGTDLFFRLLDSDSYWFPPGLFDQQSFEFGYQAFINDKPSYYSFADDTKHMTSTEFLAQYDHGN